MLLRYSIKILCLAFAFANSVRAADQPPATFFSSHCVECHDSTTKAGGLDLTSLKLEPSNAENFARWVKIHDRIESGEMPPKKQPRPPASETASVLKSLRQSLIEAEKSRGDAAERTGVRRLTRAEYENTIRDLFDLPGVALQSSLPADGSAHAPVHAPQRSLGAGLLDCLASVAAVRKSKTSRCCWRQVSITLSRVSTKRLPEALCVPCDSLRQMTA